MSQIGRAKKSITKQQRTMLRQVGRYRGLFSKVARELNLEPSHVRRVALGERQSRRVEAALARALQELDDEGRKAA